MSEYVYYPVGDHPGTFRNPDEEVEYVEELGRNESFTTDPATNRNEGDDPSATHVRVDREWVEEQTNFVPADDNEE